MYRDDGGGGGNGRGCSGGGGCRRGHRRHRVRLGDIVLGQALEGSVGFCVDPFRSYPTEPVRIEQGSLSRRVESRQLLAKRGICRQPADQLFCEVQCHESSPGRDWSRSKKRLTCSTGAGSPALSSWGNSKIFDTAVQFVNSWVDPPRILYSYDKRDGRSPAVPAGFGDRRLGIGPCSRIVSRLERRIGSVIGNGR